MSVFRYADQFSGEVVIIPSTLDGEVKTAVKAYKDSGKYYAKFRVGEVGVEEKVEQKIQDLIRIRQDLYYEQRKAAGEPVSVKEVYNDVSPKELLTIMAEKETDRVTEKLEGVFDSASDNLLANIGLSIYSGLGSFASGMASITPQGRTAYSANTVMKNANDRVVSKERSEMNRAEQVLFDVTQNLVANAPSMVAGGLTGSGIMGAAITFAKTFGADTAYAEAAGHDTKRAMGYAFLDGLNQAFLDYLGHIPGVGGITDVAAGAISKNVNNAVLRFLTSRAVQTAGEAVQENLQTVIENGLKNAVLNENNDTSPFSEEALYSAFLGALSSTVTGGVQDVVVNAANQSVNKVQIANAIENAVRDSYATLQNDNAANVDSALNAGTVESNVNTEENAATTDTVAPANPTAISQEDVETIVQVARRSGTNVLFVESLPATADGSIRNGSFDRKTNTLYIAADCQNPVVEVVKHELTHKVANTAQYERLVNYVKSSPQVKADLEQNGITWDRLVELKQAQYRSAGEELSTAEAEEEVVADFVAANMLSDRQAITSLYRADKPIFYRFLYEVREGIKIATSKGDQKALLKAEKLYKDAIADKADWFYKKDAESVNVEGGDTRASISPKFKTALEKWDGKTTGFTFVVGNTSLPLQEAGVPNKQIRMDATKVKTLIEKHEGMDIDVIAGIPELLETPILVVDSKKNANSKLIFGDLYDKKNRPVTVVLLLTPTSKSGNQLDVIKISSAQGRGNTQGLLRHEDGTPVVVRYIDEKRIQNWLNANRLQLPLRSSNLDSSSTTIPKEVSGVNTYFMQEGQKKSSNLQKYSVGTTDFEARMRALAEQYGRIPQGEKADRDIVLPRSVDGRTNVSQAARTIAESKSALPDEMVDAYNEKVLQGAMNYQVTSNKKEWEHAAEKLEDLGFDKALEQWRGAQTPDGNVNANMMALGELLLQQAAKDRNTALVMSLSSDIALNLSHAGQAAQAAVLIKRASPEWKVEHLQKMVNKLNATGKQPHLSLEKRNAASNLREQIKMAERRGDLAEELRAELNRLDGTVYLPQAVVDNILQQTTPEGVEQAYVDALVEIASQQRSTWSEKWTQWRYFAMLANPRTHIRNVVSNLIFAPVVQIKDTVKFALEAGYSKINGPIERTASLKNHLRVESRYRDFVNEQFDKNKDLLTGTGKYSSTSILRDNKKVLPKPLDWLAKKNSAALEWEDAKFLSYHYKRALAQFMSVNNYDPATVSPETLAKGNRYAIREAKKATFRDESALADTLSSLSKQNPFLHVAVESVVPFKKTPVNIVKRGAEYSPIGFFEAAWDLHKLRGGDSNVTINDVLDKVASGLTGSALLALGFVFARMGLLKGRSPEDKKERNFESLLGEQEYSVNIKGLGTVTLDWAAPAALPLFVGVELYDLLVVREEKDFAAVLESLTNLAEPVVDMSMMKGLQDFIESMQYGNGFVGSLASSLITGYLSQGIPTLFGQIARTADGTRRQNYVEQGASFSDARYALEQAKGKIPGLENTKKEYINQWGETESTGNVAQRLFNNFVAPWYFRAERSGNVESELERLYAETQNSTVLPSGAVKSFSYSGQKYVLSADENTAYAKAQGQTAYQMLQQTIASEKYQTLDDELKSAVIEKVYKYAQDYAKEVVVTSRGESYKRASANNTADDAEEQELLTEYLIAECIYNNTDADKNAAGKTINGSKSRKVMTTLRELGFTSAEIAKVIQWVKE